MLKHSQFSCSQTVGKVTKQITYKFKLAHLKGQNCVGLNTRTYWEKPIELYRKHCYVKRDAIFN